MGCCDNDDAEAVEIGLEYSTSRAMNAFAAPFAPPMPLLLLKLPLLPLLLGGRRCGATHTSATVAAQWRPTTPPLAALASRTKAGNRPLSSCK